MSRPVGTSNVLMTASSDAVIIHRESDENDYARLNINYLNQHQDLRTMSRILPR